MIVEEKETRESTRRTVLYYCKICIGILSSVLGYFFGGT